MNLETLMLLKTFSDPSGFYGVAIAHGPPSPKGLTFIH